MPIGEKEGGKEGGREGGREGEKEKEKEEEREREREHVLHYKTTMVSYQAVDFSCSSPLTFSSCLFHLLLVLLYGLCAAESGHGHVFLNTDF